MKLHVEYKGRVCDYETRPMREGRFRRLCALAAAALYVCLVVGVTRLCGFLGLLVIAATTLIAFAIDAI